MSEEIKSLEKFNFSFGGGKKIDAVAFADTVKEIITLLQISAKEYDQNSTVKLDIHANQEGSFESILEAVIEIKRNIFTHSQEYTLMAKNVVGSVKDIFDIKKHLGGKKAKKITKNTHNENFIITNENNENIEKSNISTKLATENKDVDKSVVNITNIVIQNGRDYFSIETDRDGKTKIESKDYNNLQQLSNAEDESYLNNQGSITGNEYIDKLIVLTQTINEGSKWEFEDGENKIKVIIQDEEFLNRYKKRQQAILPRAVLKVCRRTDKIFEKDKWKNIYYILKVIEIEKEDNLFHKANDN